VVLVKGDTTGLEVRLERRRGRKLVCSGCGARAPGYDTLKERKWRHVPLWGIPVKLLYGPRRVRCPKCGIKVEQMPWGPSKSPLTVPLVILLATGSKLLAMQVVARLFRVNGSTVAAAVKRAVEYGLAHRDTSGILYIGMDEISRRRGHIYHTQVYDLSAGRLLIRHLQTAVDDVRKAEAEQLKKKNPELLKGTKYLWLKNPWNLSPKQRERLGYLEKLNLKTNRAYVLKESFHLVWTYPNRGWAKRFLRKWFWWATHSRLQPMRDFAWLLRRHLEDIVSYFKLPISNGAVEGLNNKAKVIALPREP